MSCHFWLSFFIAWGRFFIDEKEPELCKTQGFFVEYFAFANALWSGVLALNLFWYMLKVTWMAGWRNRSIYLSIYLIYSIFSHLLIRYRYLQGMDWFAQFQYKVIHPVVWISSLIPSIIVVSLEDGLGDSGLW